MRAVRDSRTSIEEAPPVADEVIDTVGLYCPVPIIRTAERMKRLTPRGTLEILSDDRVILIDMPAWCRSNGHEYLGSRRDEEAIHLYVRKKAEERP